MRIMKLFSLLALFLLTAANAQGWTANWIWQSADGPANTWLCLRKTVTLSAVPTAAPTRIAAENNYWLYINGQLVVPGSGLDLRPNLTNTYYDSIDLAPYLVSGNNVIAVLAWYKGGSNGYSQMMVAKGGFLFESHLTGATPATIVSDNTWKVLVHPSFSKTAQAQEWGADKWVQYPVIYDARNSPGDWTSLTFSDNAWTAATLKGVPPAAPWNTMVYRTIPMHKSFTPISFQNQSSLPTSITANMTFTGNVGINIQGRAYLKITAPAGVNIAIRMNEWYTENYITSSGTQEYTTYQWQNPSGEPWSAHDVEFAFTNVTGTVTITSLKFQQSGYDADFVGSFNCSNSRLNTLWTKSKNTSYVCMRDQFFDCPDRERGQWWGDVSEQILYSFYLYDAKASLLAKKGFRELMNTQKTDYSLYTTAPGASFHLPDQNLAAVISLYDYFLYTGDSALVKELYPKVATYIKNYVAGTRDGSGMLVLQNGPWNWIDWGSNLDIQTGSANTVVNGLFVRLMEAAKVMATVYGSSADVTTYNGYQTAVRNNFNTYFWNANSKAYVFHRLNGTQSTTIDDRSNAWAVLAGVTDSAKRAGVLNILNSQQNASPYQERYIEDAMFVMGKDSAAIARMLSYYQPDIDSWSSTMWERMGSIQTNNHAWAASPCYLLGACVAGIKPTAAGFSSYQVMPMLGPLTAVSVSVPSNLGTISTTDSLQSTRFTMLLASPAGSQALVGIPRRHAWQSVTANGNAVWNQGTFVPQTGVTGAGVDSQYIKFNVAPGTWQFVAALTPVSARGLSGREMQQSKELKVSVNGNRMALHVVCPGAFGLQVFDAAGKTLATCRGIDQGDFVLPRALVARRVCYVHLASNGTSIIKRMTTFGK
jgi:hypothetical protein